MDQRVIFTVFALFIFTLGPMPNGQAETLYIENEKGANTMILRTKPKRSTPRPRREYSDTETLLIAPSIQFESSGRPYYPRPQPPHPKPKPPHHWHKPKGPNAPSRPYSSVAPQE